MRKIILFPIMIMAVLPVILGSCRSLSPRVEPLPPSPTPRPATPPPSPSPTPEAAEIILPFQPAEPLELEILVHSDKTGNNQVYVLDCATGEMRRLAESAASDCFASWSPDRERIVFTSDRDGNREIYLINADGTGLERLTDNPGPDIFPVWSPDNRTVVYFAGREGVDNLRAYDTVEGSHRALTEFPEGTGGAIAFSPDGSKIFFGYDRVGRYKIYQLDTASGEPKEIITHALQNSRMTAWDEPDGLVLFYVSGKAGQDDIWMSYVADGRFLNITRDAAADHSPALSPEGGAVIFSSQRDGENWQLYLVSRSGRPIENKVIRITDDEFNYWYPHVR